MKVAGPVLTRMVGIIREGSAVRLRACQDVVPLTIVRWTDDHFAFPGQGRYYR